jgi:hypothetical protein
MNTVYKEIFVCFKHTFCGVKSYENDTVFYSEVYYPYRGIELTGLNSLLFYAALAPYLVSIIYIPLGHYFVTE